MDHVTLQLVLLLIAAAVGYWVAGFLPLGRWRGQVMCFLGFHWWCYSTRSDQLRRCLRVRCSRVEECIGEEWRESDARRWDNI